ncbi:MAG: hypothetical protein AB1538_05425 [Bacillota bacterium]
MFGHFLPSWKQRLAVSAFSHRPSAFSFSCWFYALVCILRLVFMVVAFGSRVFLEFSIVGAAPAWCYLSSSSGQAVLRTALTLVLFVVAC